MSTAKKKLALKNQELIEKGIAYRKEIDALGEQPRIRHDPEKQKQWNFERQRIYNKYFKE